MVEYLLTVEIKQMIMRSLKTGYIKPHFYLGNAGPEVLVFCCILATLSNIVEVNFCYTQIISSLYCKGFQHPVII